MDKERVGPQQWVSRPSLQEGLSREQFGRRHERGPSGASVAGATGSLVQTAGATGPEGALLTASHQWAPKQCHGGVSGGNPEVADR